MSAVELSDQEWGQLMNILATTREHSWTVTNPLLMKIGEQLRVAHLPTNQPSTKQTGIKLDTNGQEAKHE